MHHTYMQQGEVRPWKLAPNFQWPKYIQWHCQDNAKDRDLLFLQAGSSALLGHGRLARVKRSSAGRPKPVWADTGGRPVGFNQGTGEHPWIVRGLNVGASDILRLVKCPGGYGECWSAYILQCGVQNRAPKLKGASKVHSWGSIKWGPWGPWGGRRALGSGWVVRGGGGSLAMPEGGAG